MLPEKVSPEGTAVTRKVAVDAVLDSRPTVGALVKPIAAIDGADVVSNSAPLNVIVKVSPAAYSAASVTVYVGTAIVAWPTAPSKDTTLGVALVTAALAKPATLVSANASKVFLNIFYSPKVS